MQFFLVWIICYCLIPLNLFADVIKLRDGKTVEGRILKETETELIIKNQFGTVSIQKNKISNVRIGYIAVSVCYSLKKAPAQEICAKQLLNISEHTVQLVTKDSTDPPEIVNLNDIYKLDIRKQPGEDVIPFLKDDTRLSLQLKSGSEKGLLLSHSDAKIKFKTDNGIILEISEEEILSAEVFTKPKEQNRDEIATIKNDPLKRNFEINKYHYLIPGLGQHQKGERRKSIFLFSSTVLFVTGMLVQAKEAQTAMTSQNYILLPYNNSLAVIDDPGKNKSEFNVHQKNYYAFASGLLITYLLNAIDIRRGNIDNQSLNIVINAYPDSNRQSTAAFQIQYTWWF